MRRTSQNGAVQSTRQPRLTGRLSPQLSLRRIGPAITEVLCTSVRPKHRSDTPAALKRQKFRPASAADAVLCLEERAEADGGDNERELDSRATREKPIGPQLASIPSINTVPPPVGPPSGQRTPASRLPIPEKRGSLPPPPPVGKDPAKVQPSGLVIHRQTNNIRGRRASKALPSLPPPTPSPRKATFAPSPNPSKGPFQTRRDKVLRGQGPPVVTAPAMKDVSASSASEYSNYSGLSHDSAEQTWNMINSMMRAVGEEEVKRARESLALTSGNTQRKATDTRTSGAYVTFPRMRRMQEGQDGDGSSSDSHSSSERTARTSSIDSSSTYCTSVTQKDKDDLQSGEPPWVSRPRSTALSLTRRASVASVFSIVIQPTRERSYEVQDALVQEDKFPSRIKGILEYMHDRVESTLCTRTWTVSRPTTPKEAELHPDLVMAIGALRSVSIEDIQFD